MLFQNFVGQPGAVVFHIQGQPGAVLRLAAAFPQRNVNSAHSGHGFRSVLDQVDQDARKVFAGHAHRYGAALSIDGQRDGRPGQRSQQAAIGEKFLGQIPDRLRGDVFPLPRVHSRCDELGRSVLHWPRYWMPVPLAFSISMSLSTRRRLAAATRRSSPP